MSEKGTKSSNKQYIGFMLGSEEFTTPISLVQEIVEIPKVTYVPSLPPYVEGVMNLRGRIIPVVDMKKRLEFGEKTLSIDSRVIIFRTNRVVGFIVDSITQVFGLSDDRIEPPSGMMLARPEGKFVLGIAKLPNRLPIILDVAKIIENSKSKYYKKRNEIVETA